MTLSLQRTSVGADKRELLAALVLILVGVMIFLPRATAVVSLDHDDAISVLAATCNQGRFEGESISGQLVRVADWQHYWQVSDSGCFSRIGTDLARYDIHPPLYFWLLHSWFSIFGVSIFSGLALNLAIMAITVTAVFACCRLIGASTSLSFIASLAWMLSLPSRTAFGIVRQYALFSMLTAILLVVMILWLKQGRRRDVVSIGVVVTAGMLTHYQFAIPAASMCAFALLIHIGRRERREAILLAMAALSALLVFVLFHPAFLHSMARADEQNQPFTPTAFAERLGAALTTVLQLFNPFDWSHPLPYGLLEWSAPLAIVINVLSAALGIIGIALVAILVRRAVRAGRPFTVGRLLKVENLPLFAAVTSWVVVVALYVLCVSPVHAIGLQYLHFITPLLFVGLAQCARTVENDLPKTLAVSIPAVVIVAGLAATALSVGHRAEQTQVASIGAADVIVVDSDKRGILPSVLWHAKPGAEVLAAMQQDLLSNPALLSRLGEGRLVYVSSQSYGNSAQKRDLLLQQFIRLGHGTPTRQPAGVVPPVPLGGAVYTFRR